MKILMGFLVIMCMVTSEDKSTIFNNFKFDYSRVGEFYFEPFPLVGKSINLPHSLLRTLNTMDKIWAVKE